MALFIQSANVLVSRVAQWVGATPQSTGFTVNSYNAATSTITPKNNTFTRFDNIFYTDIAR